ncbi:hypothetical protein GKJPGBOP_00103 [Streptomyces paromomycinus]|uniref:Uncharacterized protein n=1 Tax=Streptomyces paromomycinus TaxID=92743 RepID=A0A401VTP3_STREY|nr:hypothetical protein GKJPGBOP_00103 [Streptomyces paromomycinus]
MRKLRNWIYRPVTANGLPIMKTGRVTCEKGRSRSGRSRRHEASRHRHSGRARGLPTTSGGTAVAGGPTPVGPGRRRVIVEVRPCRGSVARRQRPSVGCGRSPPHMSCRGHRTFARGDAAAWNSGPFVLGFRPEIGPRADSRLSDGFARKRRSGVGLPRSGRSEKKRIQPHLKGSPADTQLPRGHSAAIPFRSGTGPRSCRRRPTAGATFSSWARRPPPAAGRCTPPALRPRLRHPLRQRSRPPAHGRTRP